MFFCFSRVSAIFWVFFSFGAAMSKTGNSRSGFLYFYCRGPVCFRSVLSCVEASPTGSLALSAAKSYKIGQERVDAIEAREHEHLEWQRHHHGDEGRSEPEYGGPDDFIGGVTDLYPSVIPGLPMPPGSYWHESAM